MVWEKNYCVVVIVVTFIHQLIKWYVVNNRDVIIKSALSKVQYSNTTVQKQTAPGFQHFSGDGRTRK
jgi:hypothetical protein